MIDYKDQMSNVRNGYVEYLLLFLLKIHNYIRVKAVETEEGNG